MRTLEDIIIAIDAKKAGIICYLRSIVLSCSPQIDETTQNTTITYFYNNFYLCSIVSTEDGVELFLSNGKKLCDPFKILKSTEENNFKIALLNTVKSVDPYKIIVLLKQAILLNELKEVQFQHEVKLLSK